MNHQMRLWTAALLALAGVPALVGLHSLYAPWGRLEVGNPWFCQRLPFLARGFTAAG